MTNPPQRSLSTSSVFYWSPASALCSCISVVRAAQESWVRFPGNTHNEKNVWLECSVCRFGSEHLLNNINIKMNGWMRDCSVLHIVHCSVNRLLDLRPYFHFFPLTNVQRSSVWNSRVFDGCSGKLDYWRSGLFGLSMRSGFSEAGMLRRQLWSGSMRQMHLYLELKHSNQPKFSMFEYTVILSWLCRLVIV